LYLLFALSYSLYSDFAITLESKKDQTDAITCFTEWNGGKCPKEGNIRAPSGQNIPKPPDQIAVTAITTSKTRTEIRTTRPCL
jgi:hypothetical protein